MTSNDRLNLYDLAPPQLHATLSEFVSPPFRIQQIAEWMYSRGVDSFDAMSNLPKDVRAKLTEQFTLEFPQVVERTAPASDGSKTGFFGAGRNLTPSEMVGQYFTVQREHQIAFELMNVVFMGMGEPLLNFDHLVTTLEILYAKIAPKRITVSTAGIIPGVESLAKLERRPNLAVSINAPDQKRREEIMPITKKYPLQDLIAALHRYPNEKGREITIEYVLLSGYNDSQKDAIALARLIRGLRTKVNAIPFNEDPNLPKWMQRPSDDAIDDFADTLVRHGAHVTVRRSKGREIAAACGQLRGKSERKSPQRRVDRPLRIEPADIESDSIHRERH